MTLTDERAGFLRRICEEPDEDTVRLVYADWLEENGEADRAEFIRVQCETSTYRAPLVKPSYRIRFQHLLGREERLLHGFADGRDLNWLAWSGLKESGVLIGKPWHERLTYTRGFISEVHLPVAAFTESVARELFSRHPATTVRLTDFVFGLLPTPTLQEWPFRIYENNVPLWNFRPHGTYLPYQPGNELTGGREVGVYRDREYPTRAEASDALSLWCVNWGRSLANPPLPALRRAAGPSRP